MTVAVYGRIPLRDVNLAFWENYQYDLLAPSTVLTHLHLQEFKSLENLTVGLDHTHYQYPRLAYGKVRIQFVQAGAPFEGSSDFPHTYGLPYWLPSWLPRNIGAKLVHLNIQMVHETWGPEHADNFTEYFATAGANPDVGLYQREQLYLDEWYVRGGYAFSLSPKSALFTQYQARNTVDYDAFNTFLAWTLPVRFENLATLALPMCFLVTPPMDLPLQTRRDIMAFHVRRLLLRCYESQYQCTLHLCVKTDEFDDRLRNLFRADRYWDVRGQLWTQLQEAELDSFACDTYMHFTFQFHLPSTSEDESEDMGTSEEEEEEEQEEEEEEEEESEEEEEEPLWLHAMLF
jgi:hypothetical protein